MKALQAILLIGLVTAFVYAPSAPAITVETTYIGGSAPRNTAGAGNLIDIFNAAARVWESAYQDSFTLHLYFGWAPLGDAGTHTMIEQGNEPNREIVGLILFDNSEANSFFLDPTPEMNEEFRRLTEEYQDLGGGLINVARVFSQPIGDAAGRTDLLTVALHEIGHALGICNNNVSFIEQSREGFLAVRTDLAFAGTVVPLASNFAGVTSHIDANLVFYGSVMAGVGGDERRIPSALDILVNAQISGFENFNLDPNYKAGQSSTATAGVIRDSDTRVARRIGR